MSARAQKSLVVPPFLLLTMGQYSGSSLQLALIDTLTAAGLTAMIMKQHLGGSFLKADKL